MAEARASLNNYRQSPRKVRVVADLIRGKSVEEALDILTYVPKRAGLPLRKLLSSAHANAGKSPNLIVKKVSVDGGAILYRRRPRSRGMANPIRKRTSHIDIILAEKPAKK
ncbi:50S ribosomal protein L22 [Candidatus Parcubacteria bacterium]|nr:50S ribosomal protein L22 [Candidatus Parcubacteria bacterium]